LKPARSRLGAAVRLLTTAAALAVLVWACGGNPPNAPTNPHTPVLNPIDDVSLVETESQSIPISAADADGDSLVFSATGLPAFARLVEPGPAGAVLAFDPNLGDAGTYGPVVVRASDGTHADSVSFQVTVAAAPQDPGALFYEPPSFCLGEGSGGSNLLVYNLGTQDLHWHAIHVPAGSQGFGGDHVVSAQDFITLTLVWVPEGPYPALDSLVALTNDPDRPRVTVPIRYEGPGAPADILPPDPPLLLSPKDGAVFAVGDSITAVWSELSDCSGIDHYRIEIALTPDFQNPVFKSNVQESYAVIDVEPGDEGKAYWRVYGVDGAGLNGRPSAIRSWTITP
jgi:hypothetical protein